MSNLCLVELVEDTSFATCVPAITWECFISISVAITQHDFSTSDVGKGQVDVINFLIWDITGLEVSRISRPVSIVPNNLLS
jgi:hypothetical protein